MGGGSSHNKLKRAFAEQRGLCFWCGCHTVLFDPAMVAGRKTHKTPINLATFDHAYNRIGRIRSWTSVQGKYHPGVLACRICNNARGALDVILSGRGIDIDSCWIFDFSRFGIVKEIDGKRKRAGIHVKYRASGKEEWKIGPTISIHETRS